jgi:hypothetical protein
MILIISFENNEHVERVRAHLAAESIVLDQAWFPSALRLDSRISNDYAGACLMQVGGRTINLTEVGAVWNRRIRPFTLHPELEDPTARLFAWSESNEALQGTWHALDRFWMNPLVADEVSQRKIRQLQVAREVGLSIPETLVTNDPAVARDFLESCGPGRVIRKAFRNIPDAPRGTHIVEEADLALLDSVRFAPVTFQRYVPADLDLRVTVVEEEVFAASIASTPEFHADYRPGLGSAKVEAFELPDDVQTALLALMERLDLKYGAVDFRVTPEGECVFLEVNPAGEYLFASDRTGQPVPEAIAACLDRHNQEHMRFLATA